MSCDKDCPPSRLLHSPAHIRRKILLPWSPEGSHGSKRQKHAPRAAPHAHKPLDASMCISDHQNTLHKPQMHPGADLSEGANWACASMQRQLARVSVRFRASLSAAPSSTGRPDMPGIGSGRQLGGGQGWRGCGCATRRERSSRPTGGPSLGKNKGGGRGVGL